MSNDASIYSSTNNSSTNIINFFYTRPQSMHGTFYRKDIRFREREIEENMKNCCKTVVNTFFILLIR